MEATDRSRISALVSICKIQFAVQGLEPAYERPKLMTPKLAFEELKSAALKPKDPGLA